MLLVMKKMYYGQCGEDEYLYQNYFKEDDTENGFFIELGAMDGITYSNTLFYEKYLGWKGILIEPQINMFNQLVKNRPNCNNFNYAVSEIDGEVEFIGNHAIGGIESSMGEYFKNAYKFEEKDKYYVKSKPFRDIIKDIKIEKVDLFSIDVEGGEMGILTTFDWDIHVRLILIEKHNHNPKSNKEIYNFLKNKNFILADEIHHNDIWINVVDLKK
jgi:FkbM family methyltransferase